MTKKRLYLLGAGGAAREIISECKNRFSEILTVEKNASNNTISEEQFISAYTKNDIVVLAVGNTVVREKILDKLNGIIEFSNLVLTDNIVEIQGKNNVLMPGVRCNTGVGIGNHNYLNYDAFVGHDSLILDNNIIGPRAIINGMCRVSNSFIGSGAIIDPRTELEDCIVSSGIKVPKGIYKSKILISNDQGFIQMAKG